MSGTEAIQPVGVEPKPLHPAQEAKLPSSNGERLRLRRAVSDFEGLFISYMLKSMQGTIPESGEKVDSGGDVLRDVGWEKVGESLAHKGGFGLGDMLFEQLNARLTIQDSSPEDKPDGTVRDLKPQGAPFPLDRSDPARPLPSEPVIRPLDDGE